MQFEKAFRKLIPNKELMAKILFASLELRFTLKQPSLAAYKANFGKNALIS